MSSNSTLLPDRVRSGRAPEQWAKWAARLLVFVGIPLVLFGTGYQVGMYRGAQVVRDGRGAPATAAPATNGAEEAFAARFATAYLSYDQANVQQYRAQLQPYLAQNLDPGTLWDGQGTQQVLEALPVSTAKAGNGVDRVTVAVLVQGGTWLYLGIPVHADRAGFVVVAEPALLPVPGSASWSPSNAATQDPQLSTQLRSNLSAFFAAYAAGQQAQLGYYSTPGANLGGLGGEVKFVRLDQLVVDQGGARRTATAEVTWQPASEPGASLQESYRLILVQQGGKWLVSSVTPAGGS